MIELQTFGAVDLRLDGREVRSVLSQPKRLALLVHLVVGCPGGFRTRDALLGLFWPESDGDRARNSLRQSLHYLRRSLGDGVVVSRNEREVGVDPAQLTCDAPAFEEALAADRLEAALELYRGDFLPGFYVEEAPDLQRWIEERRAEFARRALNAAVTLADREEARGEARTALVWARRACALAPHDETALRRLVGLLVRAGETAAALEAFADLERRLEAEYGASPSPETLALVAAVREGRTGASASSAPIESPTPAPGDLPPSIEVPAPAPIAAAAEAPAPVAPEPAAIPNAPAPPVPVRAVPGPRPALRVLTAAALVVLLGSLAWLVRDYTGPSTALADEPPSLAILPFVNMTGDPAREYLGDGLTEELLNVMAAVPGLQVTARTSSFAFKGRDVPVDSIGRALGVTHLVEGSVRLDGDEVRITAQLVETGTGFHLWSRTFAGEIDNLFELQDRMSRAIGRELQLKLVGVEAGSRAETRDARAHELLLQANQLFRQGGREHYARAAALLEEAVLRDPGYARARATLANVIAAQGQFNQVPRDSAYARARVLAEEALALRPVPEAHLALARLADVQGWDTAAAGTHYRQARELSPADSRVLQMHGMFLGRTGRVEEGLALLREAAELDPLNQAVYSNLGATLMDADRVDEAIAAYHQGLLLSPGDPIILSNLANGLGRLGRYDEALAAIDSAFEGDPADEYLLGLRGFLELRAGHTEKADATLRLLESRPGTSRYRLATLYGIKGDLDRVLDLLEQAVALREEEVLNLRDPGVFPGIRHHPRMIAIMERIEGGAVKP